MKIDWKGNIQFNLISIPVVAYKVAKTSQKKKFSLRHKTDNGKIRYVKCCATCGCELKDSDIVKVYRKDGKEIPVRQEALNKLKIKKSKTFIIEYFTAVTNIDQVYWKDCYYLHPIEGTEKNFLLFQTALEKTGLAGIAQFSQRGQVRDVMIFPRNNRLVFYTLFYKNELTALPRIKLKAKFSKKEVELIINMIKVLAKQFKPKQSSVQEKRIDKVIKESEANLRTIEEKASELILKLGEAKDANRGNKEINIGKAAN